MTNSISKKQLLELTKKLVTIASKYADMLYEYGGCLYEGVSVDHHGEVFRFAVGPTTHGISQVITLPLDLIDNCTDEMLQGLADEQRCTWQREKEERTCKTCGHVEFYGGGFKYGNSF